MGMLPQGDITMVPLNRQMRLPPHHFVLIMSLKPTGKTKLEKLTHITKEKQGCCCTVVAASGTQGSSMGLVLPCSILKVQENYSNQKNRTIKHSEPSGIKVWVTPSVQKPE